MNNERPTTETEAPLHGQSGNDYLPGEPHHTDADHCEHHDQEHERPEHHRRPERDAPDHQPSCVEYVEIEGKEYAWPAPRITVAQIRELGHLPADQPVIEIDPDNVEHQLAPDAVVTLKPGHCFGKKPRFKRGHDDRMAQEMVLLWRHFPQAEQHGAWIKIPDCIFPGSHWGRESGTVCFEVPIGFPGNPPYGFYILGGIRLKAAETVPQNYQEPAATPFPGTWGKFSWTHDGDWHPTGDVVSGNNLMNFVCTFGDRFKEAI